MSDLLEVRLIKTCDACPEQYDAYLGTQMIGYLRLRHGRFTVEYPDSGGDLVYWANPQGDGVFDCEERDIYLTTAVIALVQRHLNRQEVDVSYKITHE